MKRNTSTISTRGRRGFTLTEVLLVLAILGVIAAMVIPNLLGAAKTAYIKQTKVNIVSLENIAGQYAIAHDGEYPHDINQLMAPGQDSNGKPISAFVDKIPKDGWNQQLHYEFPNTKAQGREKPAIWSSGPNKQNEEGGGDDISNWES